MNVLVDKNKLDILANAISAKSGESLTLTLDEMVEAVDGIEAGSAEPVLQAKTYIVDSAGTDTVTADSGYDGLSEVEVDVPSADYEAQTDIYYTTVSGQRKWRSNAWLQIVGDGWITANGYSVLDTYYNAIPTGTTITPTESSQTIGGANTMMEGAVTVNAIPSNYVGSGIVRRDSEDIWLNSSTGVFQGESGYYSSPFSYQVPTKSATAITPTESSQTAVAKGYYTTGAVTVNAIPSNYVGSGITQRSSSDLTASGATVTVPSGYYSAQASKSVSTGSEGTPTATKGSVSKHSVSVTPSVTNTAGWISGGTKTGTAVTVSASELASGNKAITQNGTGIDVVGYSTVSVDVQGGGGSGMTVATATTTPSTANASIQFTGLSGEPTSFVVTSASDLATGASPYKTAAVVFDGTDLHGQIVTNTSNANASYSTSFTKSYSNGTLTITGSGTNFQANQYKLVYTYGGNSANIGTAETQVGSGATSVTFTGLTDEPDYFSVIFKSNFGTSSGYQRVMAVAYDGTNTYGVAMDSGAKALSSWSYTYNNGSLTVTSTGTNNGGYFHQPGYYQLTYGVGGTVEPIEIDVVPLSVTTNGTYTAPSGTAYSPVTVNVSGGGANIATATMTNSSNQNTSISFTLPSGRTPKAFFARLTSQIARNSNSRYYYVFDMRWDGSSTGGVAGNTFYMYSGTLTDVTSGYSYSQSGTTFTLSSTGSRSASPGSFYNGGYELVYIY